MSLTYSLIYFNMLMYNLRRMSNKFKALICLMSFFVVFRYVNTKVNAAGYNKDCIVEVGEYTKALVDAIEAKGGLSHIKLLSPVVNLTYDDGVGNASITLNALAQGAGNAWGKLDGIAGNADYHRFSIDCICGQWKDLTSGRYDRYLYLYPQICKRIRYCSLYDSTISYA